MSGKPLEFTLTPVSRIGRARGPYKTRRKPHEFK